LATKVKPKAKSVEVHPQLSNNGHPVDAGLVGAAGSLWPCPGASTPCTRLLEQNKKYFFPVRLSQTNFKFTNSHESQHSYR